MSTATLETETPTTLDQALELLAARDAEIVSLRSKLVSENEAWMDECRQSIARRETWLADHDDKPRQYLGYDQPGASPTFYGPDAVVVDGDWLEGRLLLLSKLSHPTSLRRLPEGN